MFDAQKVKLGIAPIAWTNDDLPDLGAENTFAQCISEMALAGYAGCEAGGRFPRDLPALRKALALRGLRVCNAWFSSYLTSRPPTETYREFSMQVAWLRELGAGIIGVSEQGNSIQGRLDLPILVNKPVYSEKEWQLVCRGFNEMGRLAREQGLKMVVHHHLGTGVQTASEIERLMRQTDKNLVGLLFDTGHLAAAGEDMMAVLEKHSDRIWHVHLKDFRPSILEDVKKRNMSFLDAVRAGLFTVPGDGAIDFAPVFRHLAADYRGWLVVEAEQDPAKAEPLEYALLARDYIRRLTGL